MSISELSELLDTFNHLSLKDKEYAFDVIKKQLIEAKRYIEGTNLVLLAPDVAKAFQTEEAVNEALRLVIKLRKIPGDMNHGAPTI